MFIINYFHKTSTLCYNYLMQIALYILLFVIGSCVGSFLCCQARRLHLRTTAGKHSRKSLGSRSVCVHCHYQLAWYDNIPLLSWLALRGKCRKCGHSIGIAEFLSELGLGLAYALLGNTITIATAGPLAWGSFIAVLALATVLGFLAIYDGLYGELPVLYLTISIICATIVLILQYWSSLLVAPFSMASLLPPLGSVAILGGLYFILYLVSHGKWVGDGDWLLGIAIGLALASPWLALITLFLANTLACLVSLPAFAKSRTRRIHFGPFMVAAGIIVLAFAAPLSSIITL